ncbi:MAG: glycosyltransferase family 39 protein, partial [Phycisphaerales bacterium]|nr:glycosyltransferase family 39 protein [Phycisphaerales bacterium]
MSMFTGASVAGGGTGGGSGRVWRRRAASWRVAGVTLIALCLSVYLPGLWTIPPVDRDECRFAQASRQMFEHAALPVEEQDRRIDSATGLPGGLHAGGWVVPMYGTKPRLNKPPLTYWVQVASAAAMTGGRPERDAVWMYRLPSLLSAIGTVLITWRLGVRMFDPRAAWLAGVLLAVAPMVVWDAHQARSDQLLTVLAAGAMAWRWGVGD